MELDYTYKEAEEGGYFSDYPPKTGNCMKNIIKTLSLIDNERG